MEKFERLDFEGPKKEFIKNNLMFVLGDNPLEQRDSFAQIAIDQKPKYSHNRYVRIIYRVLCKNDPVKIEQLSKKVIAVLDRNPKIKRWIKAKLINKPYHEGKRVSLQQLLSLDVNEFICQLYVTMLNRAPDKEGFDSWQRMICSSMPKEAAIFAMSKSKEFGDRFRIEDIESYKRTYQKYKAKRLLKKIPVINFIISAILMPGRIERLMTSYSIGYENSISSMRHFYETSMHKIDVLQANNYEHLCKLITEAKDNNERMNDKVQGIQENFEKHFEELDNRIIKLKFDIDDKIKGICEDIKTVDSDIKDFYDSNYRNNQGSHPYINTYINMYDPHYELETLKKANISLIEKLIVNAGQENRLDKAAIVGHYAREVYEDAADNVSEIKYLRPATLESMLISKTGDTDTELVLPEYLHQAIKIQDKVIVLNSAVASMLIMENKLQELSKKVRDELILVFDAFGGSEIAVSWGDGFSGIEKSDDGEFYRWYQGASPRGVIHIHNNTAYRKECTVRFSVTVLDTKSQIIISEGSKRFIYDMGDGNVQVSLDIVLLPGINSIIIEYLGNSIQYGTDPRLLKYAIKGFNTVCNADETSQISVNSFDAYRRQSLCNALYTSPSDEIIRNNLHLNGFFEVKSYFCSKKLDALSCTGLSRYSEANLSYKFIEQCQVSTDDGLNIYVAKRKGEYAYVV